MVSLGTAQVFTEPPPLPGSVCGAGDTAWIGRSWYLLTPRKADRTISKELTPHLQTDCNQNVLWGAWSDFFLRGGSGVRYQSWRELVWRRGWRQGPASRAGDPGTWGQVKRPPVHNPAGRKTGWAGVQATAIQTMACNSYSNFLQVCRTDDECLIEQWCPGVQRDQSLPLPRHSLGPIISIGLLWPDPIPQKACLKIAIVVIKIVRNYSLVKGRALCTFLLSHFIFGKTFRKALL